MKKIVSVNQQVLHTQDLQNFEINITNGQELGIFTGTIYCPFNTTQHPEIEKIQQDLVEIFKNHHIIQEDTPEFKKFSKSKFAYLVGYTCPDDSAEQTLQIATHVGWLFILDNSIDNPNSMFRNNPEKLPAVTKNLYDLLVEGTKNNNPTVTFSEEFKEFEKLCKISLETGKLLINKEPEKFLDAHDAYLQAICRESLNRKNQEWMSEESYKSQRKKTSAVEDVLELIWVNNNIHLNKNIRKNLDFQDMIAFSNLYVSYVNDLFSVNNEIKENTKENIVLVIQNSRNCSFKNAIDITTSLIKDAASDFKKVKTKFLETFIGTDEEKTITLTAIKYCESLMKGNLEWSKITGRYKEAEHNQNEHEDS